MSPELCPCHQAGQSNKPYHECCQPFHLGQQLPTTPEQLMRSRYSAFVKKEFEYLVDTHHPDFRGDMTAEGLAIGSYPSWLGLSVESSNNQGNSGEVTFKAWYQDSSTIDAIYEKSQFMRLEGKWYYTTGEQFNVKLPKRNETCVCQSGKKFKQCCMSKV